MASHIYYNPSINENKGGRGYQTLPQVGNFSVSSVSLVLDLEIVLTTEFRPKVLGTDQCAAHRKN